MTVMNSNQPGGQFKVAILTTSTAGGAGIAARRLQDGLLRGGHEVKLITLSPCDDECGFQQTITPEMAALSGSINKIASEENRYSGSTIIGTGYPSLTPEQLEILKYFDIINVHWVQGLVSNEAIAWLATLGKPVIWTLHDMNPFTGICHYSSGCQKYTDDCSSCPQMVDTYEDFPAKTLASKLRYWSNEIVVVTPSRWLAKCAKESAVFSSNRIEVIPNGLDTQVYTPLNKLGARRELGLPLNSNILLFSSYSNSERRKGFAELVKTSQMLRKQNVEYHVVTLGKKSHEVEELGLPYTALGYTLDEHMLASVYAASDVTVCPTLEDNLPNIILESLSCGTPVVAFNSGGVCDSVVDGVTGFLVERGNCKALADGILRAVNSDLSESCRDYATKMYSLSMQAERYQELFENVLENHDFPPRLETPSFFPENAATLVCRLSEDLAESNRIILEFNARETTRTRMIKAAKKAKAFVKRNIHRLPRATKMFFFNNRRFRQKVKQRWLR